MPLTMYQATVPALLQTLNACSAILDKAATDAASRKIDEATLLGYRLAPDMFPLAKQFQLVADFAKGTVARLAGVEVPKYEDSEKTLAELKARIAKTVAYVQGFKPGAIDGSETRAITIPMGGQPTTFTGQDYLVTFALPNFYFHATTAYAILRHCGVNIGKRDFLGRS
ncbi:MAG: DUF1993 family protein [Alphaproteobacteria bacterium]